METITASSFDYAQMIAIPYTEHLILWVMVISLIFASFGRSIFFVRLRMRLRINLRCPVGGGGENVRLDFRLRHLQDL